MFQVVKELEDLTMKENLIEMAVPRKLGLRRIEEQYDSLIEHVIKYIIFRDIDSLEKDDWLKAIKHICNFINQVELRDKRGRLKKGEYLNLLKPSETVIDYYNEILNFWIKNSKHYSKYNYEPNKEDSILLKNVYEDFINQATNIFIISQNNYSDEDSDYFIKLFLKIFNEYI